LLGRERELAELRDLLRREDVRLLVLTGAGGSGKTRLAFEAAREAAGRFANGVVFVPLATVREPGLVPAAIADAAGVQHAVGKDILQTLSVAFRSREVLLVVDNAEPVRSAAPLFVELLAQAPRLTLLVTSRVVLHLSDERVYPVQPLGVEAAAELFRQRAAAADPTVAFDEAQTAAIATICARLDGLPLAVELAAARARALTPTELLARLEPRLPLHAGGPPRSAGAPANAAGDARVELRAAERQRAPASGACRSSPQAARSTRSKWSANDGGRGRVARRPQPRPQGGHGGGLAVRDARDGPRVRSRAPETIGWRPPGTAPPRRVLPEGRRVLA
jgi:predicted ATPase